MSHKVRFQLPSAAQEPLQKSFLSLRVDAGAKWGADRDCRKEAQSDEFGRSGSDHRFGSRGVLFLGADHGLVPIEFQECGQKRLQDWHVIQDRFRLRADSQLEVVRSIRQSI